MNQFAFIKQEFPDDMTTSLDGWSPLTTVTTAQLSPTTTQSVSNLFSPTETTSYHSNTSSELPNANKTCTTVASPSEPTPQFEIKQEPDQLCTERSVKNEQSGEPNKVRNHAVIETFTDQTVHVTLVYRLQHFSRDWVDFPAIWPHSVVWFNDTEGDLECRILKIDTKEECDKYAIEYELTKQSRHNSADSTTIVGQFNLLKNEVDELKKMVSHQQNLVQHHLAGCIVESKLYIVGSHQMHVPVRSVSDAMVLGITSTGFIHLVSRQFGAATLEDKCWKELDKDTQEQMQELLSFFVLNGLTLENGAPPEPTELSIKYKVIYDSFTTMLNNRKYKNKNK